MTKSPILSVVIPCYNDGIYLTETLTKLKEQSYPHFETIIVDDGSTDHQTLALLDDIKSQGVIVLQKDNGHLSSARNFGIRHASGDIIVTLDADDYYHPTFFEKGIAALKTNPKAGVITSYIQLFGQLKKVGKPRGGNNYNFLFSNQCPACAMFRKECWEQAGFYDEQMKHGYEDWEFYIRVTALNWQVLVLPEILFYYRQTEKSMHRIDTLPHRAEIIDYIVNKHKNLYAEQIKVLMNNGDVIYKKSRISYQNIWLMFWNRISGKY